MKENSNQGQKKKEGNKLKKIAFITTIAVLGGAYFLNQNSSNKFNGSTISSGDIDEDMTHDKKEQLTNDFEDASALLEDSFNDKMIERFEVLSKVAELETRFNEYYVELEDIASANSVYNSMTNDYTKYEKTMTNLIKARVNESFGTPEADVLDTKIGDNYIFTTVGGEEIELTGPVRDAVTALYSMQTLKYLGYDNEEDVEQQQSNMQRMSKAAEAIMKFGENSYKYDETNNTFTPIEKTIGSSATIEKVSGGQAK